MDIRNLAAMPAFITKDGSEIRELLAHRNSVIRYQSLAEARVPVGGCTQEHYHPRTEEIYYITAGTGRIRIGTEKREVRPGDAIAIPPGQRHKLWNTGAEVLTLLCCCAPGYEHEDTIITEGGRILTLLRLEFRLQPRKLSGLKEGLRTKGHACRAGGRRSGAGN